MKTIFKLKQIINFLKAAMRRVGHKLSIGQWRQHKSLAGQRSIRPNDLHDSLLHKRQVFAQYCIEASRFGKL